MKALVPALCTALACSCTSTHRCDPCPIPNKGSDVPTISGERLFPGFYDTMKRWPGLKSEEYRELAADMAIRSGPTSAALYETMEKDGFIYISHVGRHVAIVFMNQQLHVRDVKSFTSRLGFSTCWKQGLILTLHRHPAEGSFVDTKVFVSTEGGSIDLQYDIE
ncbi:MAG: hypothetical protein JXA20_13290 [Spirochaetes bacterium]|nr:hypothetical protein [Spirochaetota bacterium]